MSGAPIRLRCEFVSNPQGVTHKKPRLSWWVSDPRPAELQTAYEILVASSPDKLDAQEADIWRSGRVESGQSSQVPYGGPPLPANRRVWWKVRTCDSDGLPGPWSEAAFFQTGLADVADWHGRWIASPLRGSRARGVHAVALRREFVLTQPVVSASLAVCALGDYRIEINGRAVPGSDCNAGWSDFAAQAYYQMFDVTALLRVEPNCIGILLADGYYAGALPGAGRANYGDRPQLLVHLHIEFASGESLFIGSDHEWRWRPSWVLAADVVFGEHVDARQYIEGWGEPGLDDQDWWPVEVLPEKDLKLLNQPYRAFSVRQILPPAEHARVVRNDRRYVSTYDFGQALLGRIQMNLKSAEADDILLSYSLRADFAQATQDTYTSAGAASGETYTGHFALHGFRYLRVEYTGHITHLGEVSALRVGEAEAGSLMFRSDHETLNQLFTALQNSLRAVAQTVPMRGLQAQQRLPDVAYAGTWVPFYARQTHGRALAGKWVDDLRQACSARLEALDEQEGAQAISTGVSSTVPAIPGLRDGEDEFARFETLANTVWALYRHHSDLQMLRECYGELRVAALSYKHQFGHLLRSGDVSAVYGEAGWREPVATCCMYGALRTTARIAGVLGHLGDQELLKNLAEDLRTAFRRRYLSQDGHLFSDCQSVYVAALYFNLLEGLERQTAEQLLAELVTQQRYHADVAPILTHALLPVLTRAGRLDLAYMVLLQTSEPSWLAAVASGDQLIGKRPHEMDIADVGLWEWLVESLIGVRLHEDYSVNMNGYHNVRIQPMPPFGAQFLAGSPVRFVEAALQTPYGHLDVKWWIREDCFELELLIPPGSSALVTMPDGIEQAVQSGQHRFVMDFGAGGDGVPTLLDLAGGSGPQASPAA